MSCALTSLGLLEDSAEALVPFQIAPVCLYGRRGGPAADARLMRGLDLLTAPMRESAQHYHVASGLRSGWP